MHLAQPIVAAPSAAQRLTRDLPRDQALGLRLIALAQAAAAIHMAQSAPCANFELPAQDDAHDRHLLRSQASGLMYAIPSSDTPRPAA